MNKLISLRYPIGKFEYGKSYSLIETRKQIDVLEDLPRLLKKIMKKMTRQHLDTPYRTDGWTVRQVIHHLGDSHLNAYVRMKLALTEENPVIKPYKEDAWVSLPSELNASVKDSLRLLKALHTRWVELMKTFTASDLNRTYFHPDLERAVSLSEAIALYAWHTQHHLAHIRLVTEADRPKEKKEEKINKKEKIEKAAPAKPVLERRTRPKRSAQPAKEPNTTVAEVAPVATKTPRRRPASPRKKPNPPTVAEPVAVEPSVPAKPVTARKPRTKAVVTDKPRPTRGRKPVVAPTPPMEDTGEDQA
jgi:hypothetical protein